MSGTKAMERAVKTMTQSELSRTYTRLEAEIAAERNAMKRASLKAQRAIVVRAAMLS